MQILDYHNWDDGLRVVPDEDISPICVCSGRGGICQQSKYSKCLYGSVEYMHSPKKHDPGLYKLLFLKKGGGK